MSLHDQEVKREMTQTGVTYMVACRRLRQRDQILRQIAEERKARVEQLVSEYAERAAALFNTTEDAVTLKQVVYTAAQKVAP